MDELKTLGIRHVALKVKDIQSSARFYQEVLGYRIEWQPDPKNIYLTTGFDNLALHEEAEIGITDSRLDHFGIFVASLELIDQWADRIKKQGIVLLKEPKNHRDGARSFYFSDPDGNVIQLIYHPAASNFSAAT